MARGRHRNAPLHRVLVPALLGGAAVLSAGTAWFLGTGDGGVVVLRSLTTLAAGAAVAAAFLLRRWDLEAGRKVARERAAKAGISWQVEEKQAELEEAQELVATLEAKVRAKRIELGRLRSEHADLLRRYATAETERAKALEGRRQLALEAAEPAKALPAQATDHRTSGGAPTQLTYLQACEALGKLSRNSARQEEARQEEAAARQLPEQRPGRPAVQPSQAQDTPAGPAPQPRPAAQDRPAPPPQPAPPGAGRGRTESTGGFDFFGKPRAGKH
ncbi:hypothetical protein MTQ13_11480 [Streptomyces sp. XM4011]|uniref:hypothetical protein n=1 Tax=Streptomyces sp. XM4011 TaxID=2929780 RepID=UPI001FF9C3A1|nr:hypothetical protein [Streptomyces sp. XM4011]MCK1814890.1 hypothetical protein [Streptomyces sp. XM4011]